VIDKTIGYFKDLKLLVIEIIAGAGFEPCDLRVMGPTSTPDCSTLLYELEKN
jgi:hypothetical protein